MNEEDVRMDIELANSKLREKRMKNYMDAMNRLMTKSEENIEQKASGKEANE